MTTDEHRKTSPRGRAPTPRTVVAALLTSRATVAVAESCTAGGLGWALTTVPGSSAVFLGGVLAYADMVKENVLDVPRRVLEKHGAVSKHVALAMGQNVRKMLGATYGVAITGIAGPGGGSRDKPVGTVWFAVAGPKRAVARRMRFSGTRGTIRRQAVRHGLAMLDAEVRAALEPNS